MICAGAVAGFAVVVALGERGIRVALDAHGGEEDFMRRFFPTLAMAGHALPDALRVLGRLFGLHFLRAVDRSRQREPEQQGQSRHGAVESVNAVRERFHFSCLPYA